MVGRKYSPNLSDVLTDKVNDRVAPLLRIQWLPSERVQEYPAEIHFVHYNQKYGSLTSAASKSDGLAVLGFFYQVKYFWDNPA